MTYCLNHQRLMPLLAALVIASLALLAASAVAEEAAKPEAAQAAPEKAKPISERKTESGLTIAIMKEGKGEAVQSGDFVSVHYVGTLTSDGSKFDSSRDRGEPAEFRIGVGQVIPGWDEGLVGMKPGEVRQLTIPAILAYGERSTAKIPANSELHFDIELMEVHPGVRTKTTEAGEGAVAETGDLITLTHTLSFQVGDKPVTIPAEKTMQYPLGRGSLIQGLEAGLEGIKAGETREIAVNYRLAFGEQGIPTVIPPKTNVTYTVTASKIEKGLIKIETALAGEGDPINKGDLALVNIKMTTEDGTVLVNTANRGGPRRVVLGQEQDQLPFLQHIMKGMKKGETRLATVPINFAFSEESRPAQLKEETSLKYEIKLVDLMRR